MVHSAESGAIPAGVLKLGIGWLAFDVQAGLRCLIPHLSRDRELRITVVKDNLTTILLY